MCTTWLMWRDKNEFFSMEESRLQKRLPLNETHQSYQTVFKFVYDKHLVIPVADSILNYNVYLKYQFITCIFSK